MKLKSLFTAMVCLLSSMVAFANNIQVSNVSLTGMDAGNDYTMVKFNLSWENSWRTSSTPSNWDAAWVFVKYRVNGGDWQHARLNNTGHVAATGSSLSVGLVNPAVAFNALTNPGVGAFVYRDANGNGNVNFNNVQLRWNYGANGVNDNDLIDVQVYAIEMVYVPQGAYTLGSGGTYEQGAFTNGSTTLPLQSNGNSSLIGASSSGKTITLSGTGASTSGLAVGHVLAKLTGTGNLGGLSNYDTVASVISSTQFTVKNTPSVALSGVTLQVWGPTTPLNISSEDAMSIDNTSGSLWGTSSNNTTTIGSIASNAAITLPAAFPKGYNAFYCMKYEISQAQYVDFLNSLTRTQQSAHVGTNITGTSITNRYVMSNSATLLNRNGIRCDATIPATSAVTFYNDLNGNGTPNESADGKDIAANFLSTADFMTYLDWSGLRLMTEMEFEKSARGTNTQVANEYAWGTSSGKVATAITNSGLSNEEVTPSDANMHAGNQITSGPVRVGNFARAGNTRTQSGASFYGILDLSGNVWERTVPVSHATGRAYTAIHGDGALTSAGASNVTNWPTYATPTVALRGGSYTTNTIPGSMISDRSQSFFTQTTRTNNVGGRGARTAE